MPVFVRLQLFRGMRVVVWAVVARKLMIMRVFVLVRMLMIVLMGVLMRMRHSIRMGVLMRVAVGVFVLVGVFVVFRHAVTSRDLNECGKPAVTYSACER